ncbi:Cytochrome P450 [Macleaya cordata]|uniref:Cytochrome P450 n=1 Tax=Macleaya cordata TaxID=56857 RepID=A0A200QIZ5_MACCD|nr:Cytochrome P450 [Macleaya cordata]
MEVMLSILVGAVMILVHNLWKRWSVALEDMKLPPGPRKLPIIGNLHQLNKGGELIHVALAKLAQEHGKMMTIWFGGGQPSIVVSHHEVAWEVLVSKAADYSSRTLPYMSKFTSADWQTLATSNLGPFWQTLRKGLQTTTLNPHTISAQVQLQEKDITSMILSFKEEACLNDGIVEPLIPLRRTTVQLIGRFCFGPEFKNNEFVKEMDSVIEDTIRLTGVGRLIDIFEFIRYIPCLNLPFKEAYKVKQRIEGLIRPYIDHHKSTKSPCHSCYLHFLLSQDDFGEGVIIFNLFELFLLSVDSTSNATAWALAFLIHDEKIQQKVYEEVREIGHREIVTIEEVSKLKYVNAVVKETIRMKPIAPLAVPHQAVRDSKLMGTKVKKGTPVLVNLYAMHYDPSVWVEPSRFMPERFLVGHPNNDNGSGGGGGGEDHMGAMERSLIPFGAGRRICAGMEVAKLQVALTVANLVNSFQWSSVVEGQLPDLTEDLTFILRMKTPLAARIVPRH